MNISSPLVFRPSALQRGLCALLCAGSWVVGIRTLALLLERLPVLRGTLKIAEASGEPTFWIQVGLVSAIASCVVGGVLLALSVYALLMVESCTVLVDELGIAVELAALPGFLARWAGAGRLTWKEVSSLEKGPLLFAIRGDGAPAEAAAHQPRSRASITLRFVLVDELEQLVNLIIERSPNLKFKS